MGACFHHVCHRGSVGVTPTTRGQRPAGGRDHDGCHGWQRSAVMITTAVWHPLLLLTHFVECDL